MTRDRGAVLINALVVVLAIAAIAATLLTRSETARIRSNAAQTAEQLSLYLDAAEQLLPQLLSEIEDGGTAHPGQDWARRHVFEIDRGQVAVTIADLQGRLNVNWLLSDDDYITETFDTVFLKAGVPQSLLREIADFLSPSGPRGSGYLNRDPSIWPRGGEARSLEDLRAVNGMTPAYFETLRPLLSALPRDQRVNLNTAPRPVLEAVIARLPGEVITDILTRQTPLLGLNEVRSRTSELLETEEFGPLGLDRMGTSSVWFRAELVAELEGRTLRRVVILRIQVLQTPPIRRASRWAVYD